MMSFPVSAYLAQNWCLKNLSNFTDKDTWPGNRPDLSLMENLFSILDNSIYHDPEQLTMAALEIRLKDTLASISVETLKALIYSIPKRLESVIVKKGGHSG